MIQSYAFYLCFHLNFPWNEFYPNTCKIILLYNDYKKSLIRLSLEAMFVLLLIVIAISFAWMFDETGP